MVENGLFHTWLPCPRALAWGTCLAIMSPGRSALFSGPRCPRALAWGIVPLHHVSGAVPTFLRASTPQSFSLGYCAPPSRIRAVPTFLRAPRCPRALAWGIVLLHHESGAVPTFLPASMPQSFSLGYCAPPLCI